MGKTCFSIDSAVKTRYLLKEMNIAANLLHLFKKMHQRGCHAQNKMSNYKIS